MATNKQYNQEFKVQAVKLPMKLVRRRLLGNLEYP